MMKFFAFAFLAFGIFTAATPTRRWNQNQVINTTNFIVDVGNKMFLILQDDYNLCMYHGTGPSNNLGYSWCAGISATGTHHQYAELDDSGVFCVNRDYSPIWCCATSDGGTNPPYMTAIQYGSTTWGVYNSQGVLSNCN